MGAVWSGWAVALRIARRGALTSWGRSLLVVALIGIPIAGLTAAAVLLPSTQSTLAERIQGNLGYAQAKLIVVGGPKDGVEQGTEGLYDYSVTGGGGDKERVDPRTVLPRSTRVLAIGTGAATFTTPGGETSLQVVTGPSWDPSLDGGPYALLSGHRPTAADQVLLSPTALTRLGASVGGTITMQQPLRRTLTVVGITRDRSLADSAQSVFAAATVLGRPAGVDATTFYVPSTPIDWATVTRLNAVGTTVFSREVVENPPALPAKLQFGGSTPFATNGADMALVALIVIFAVLEVALLAGSAFLVGARLQQRMLATIASVGADIPVLRRIVTASGVVLGAIGGVAGVALGLGGALLVMQLTGDGSWTRYPGVHLIWPLLIAIVVFGVLVGWIAALVPARAASRFDVVQALRGARTPQKVGKRPAVGIVLLTAGVVMTLLGGGALLAALKLPQSTGGLAQLGALGLLGGGPVVAQLGVLLCAGLLLRGVARLLERAPLAARLAARDTSRNLGRAVPAVASVMTTVFVASFAMCIANTASITAGLQYYWNTAVPGEGTATFAGSTPASSAASANRWLEVLRHDLPIRDASVLARSVDHVDDPTPSNRTADALPMIRLPEPPSDCTERSRLDATNLRCGPFTAQGPNSNASQSVSVGTLQALGLLLGHAPSASARAALERGEAIALRSDIARNDTATIDWFTPKQLQNGDLTQLHPRRTIRVVAVTDLPEHPVLEALFVIPSTAKALKLPTGDDRVLMTFTRPPTDVETDSVNQALSALANQPDSKYFTIEQGPQDFGSLIAWYTLLGCLIIAISAGATAIGLARVDGRADDLTLASLGASPRLRRSVAFVQAVIICGLGAVVGTSLGLLPAVALGVATTSFPFVPPTLQLALTALGIPIVIAVGSWLLVRNRGNLTRRAVMG